MSFARERRFYDGGNVPPGPGRYSPDPLKRQTNVWENGEHAVFSSNQREYGWTVRKSNFQKEAIGIEQGRFVQRAAVPEGYRRNPLTAGVPEWPYNNRPLRRPLSACVHHHRQASPEPAPVPFPETRGHREDTGHVDLNRTLGKRERRGRKPTRAHGPAMDADLMTSAEADSRSHAEPSGRSPWHRSPRGSRQCWGPKMDPYPLARAPPREVRGSLLADQVYRKTNYSGGVAEAMAMRADVIYGHLKSYDAAYVSTYTDHFCESQHPKKGRRKPKLPDYLDPYRTEYDERYTEQRTDGQIQYDWENSFGRAQRDGKIHGRIQQAIYGIRPHS